ncbi:protease inhibitor I42 family protein [Paucibacter sp. AS339]|uniref:protease inhibitor I42 family protein n=1 Tax=Paucibacter hankyongi TaxID=3133434 RepID=UPI0030AF045D
MRLKFEAGKPFELKLGSAPSTGYLWEPLTAPAGLRVRELAMEQAAAPSPGDGGQQVFQIQAEQPGHYVLRFQYKRRWEAQALETRVIELELY